MAEDSERETNELHGVQEHRDQNQHRDQVVQLLTIEQTALFGYIATLLGDLNDASNVLQQTNMVLWRKADEFEPGTSFQAWSRKVAYFQTLAFIRDKKRDKLVFDEELVQQLAARPSTEDDDERRVALRHCLGELSENSLDLLRLRYAPGKSLQDIAEQRNKKVGAIKMALLRIRQALVNCIDSQLQGI
jgi:RNA polymerase sigma-70 factor (ECF subfamily)